MDITNQEKGIWASLLGMVMVFGYYFGTVHWSGTDSPVRFVGAVVLLIVLQIVFNIYLGIQSRRSLQAVDERDVLISRKAYRNAYFFLSSGVLVVLWSSMAQAPQSHLGSLEVATLTANLLLLVLVLTEIFRCATQLVLYRRSA